MGLTTAQAKRWESLPGFAELAPHAYSRRRTLAEWVVVAEELAKDNHGILPNRRWLRNEYGGLVWALRRSPQAFVHIKQTLRSPKTLDEWLEIAEQLSAQHGGKLPTKKWLKDNGFLGLVMCAYRYPDKFRRFDFAREATTPQEWVIFAKTLAAKRKGILPNYKTLERAGHFGLLHAMLKHPELFASIRQNRRCKTTKEWVTIAEQLEKKYGLLPTTGWLQHNSYSGLDKRIREQPHAFRHIRKAPKFTKERLI